MNTKIIIFIIVAILMSQCVVDVPSGKIITSNGQEARAAKFPVYFTNANNVNMNIVIDACDWWNDSLFEYWPVYCGLYVPAHCSQVKTFIEYTPRKVPFIIRMGSLKDPKLGETKNTYYLSGRIKTSSIILRDGLTLNDSVLWHELGHGAFGLAHASCESVDDCYDLMCKYNYENMQLTEHEAYLIFDDLVRYKKWEYSN